MELQGLYPPPPPFYQLYTEDRDGSAERPLPPEAPPPITGEYAMLGELHTVSILPQQWLHLRDMSDLLLASNGWLTHCFIMSWAT